MIAGRQGRLISLERFRNHGISCRAIGKSHTHVESAGTQIHTNPHGMQLVQLSWNFKPERLEAVPSGFQ